MPQDAECRHSQSSSIIPFGARACISADGGLSRALDAIQAANEIDGLRISTHLGIRGRHAQLLAATTVIVKLTAIRAKPDAGSGQSKAPDIVSMKT